MVQDWPRLMIGKGDGSSFTVQRSATGSNNEGKNMKRDSVNPWDWGLKWSMDQGEIVEGASRHLHCSGQVAVQPDSDSEIGISVVSPGDIRGQMEYALGNVDAVLTGAGMTRKNLLSLRFFTTDIDGFLANYDVYAEWITAAGTRPPQSLIGVQRLVLPELMVEIEAVAAE
jgi:enamine deaminase RidA (YjgF/YER057c/UK114 family)